MIKRFNSLADFARDCARPAMRKLANHDGDAFANGLTYSDAMTLCTAGDCRLVPQAQALLDQLDADVQIRRPEFRSSPYGAYAIVPEFLAGYPDPMRRRALEESDSAPVRIVVDLFCSCGFSVAQMLRRGVTVLALAMKLQEIRPVQLQVCFGSTDGCHSGGNALAVLADVNSTPLDLATACYALTNIGLFRTCGFAQLRSIGAPDSIPADQHGAVKRELALGENDLYICPCIGAPRSIPDHEVVTDPLKWIHDQLKRFNAGDNDA